VTAVFDGLTWLRYAFKDGQTIYKQDYGITEIGVGIKAAAVEAICWSKNYQYLIEMQREMRQFLRDRNYLVFSIHGNLLRSVAETIEESARE